MLRLRLSAAVISITCGACTLDPLPIVDRITFHQNVEITLMDGSQPVAEDTPIVAGRDALLRIFLSPGEQRGPLPLSASLELDGQIVTEATAELAGPSAAADLASTLNLRIPGAALVDDLDYRVSVQSAGGSYYWPIDGPGSLTISSTNGPLQVVLVPVIANGYEPLLSPTIVKAYRDALEQLLPVAAVDVRVRDPYFFERDLCGGVAAIEMLALEILAVRATDDAPANTYYFGLFAPTANAPDFLACGGGILGMSLVGWNKDDTYARGSVGHGYFLDGSTIQSERTLVHELGHALGRRHAPCGSAGYPDSKYPHPDGAIGRWAWDGATDELKHPLRYKDIMSYCSPAWISDYHYVKLFNRIAHWNGTAEAAMAQASTSYRAIRIAEDGAATWLGSTPVRHPAGEPVTLTLSSPTNGTRAQSGYRYRWSHAGGALVLVADQTLRGWDRLALDGRSIPIPETLQ